MSSYHLYTRAEHGSVPVRVVSEPRRGNPGVFESGGRRFGSARELFRVLTGTGDRVYRSYFRIGESPVEVGALPDLSWGPRVLEAPRPERGLIVVAPSPVGIDLAARGGEVRKLFFSQFGGQVMASGLDPEDVLQEVYKGILIRNSGRCPFDVRKSSFGHYVYMVINCVLSNYRAKVVRRRGLEQVGVQSFRDGEIGGVDAAQHAERADVGVQLVDADSGVVAALGRLRDVLEERGAPADLMVSVASCLYRGMNRREIGEELGLRPGQLSRVISELQEHAAELR